jgi:N-acetylmuramoyl-L-alanine amidase
MISFIFLFFRIYGYGGGIIKRLNHIAPAIAVALCVIFSLMPLASAADIPNLMNTLDKDKFVDAVSNNANADNTNILSKDEVAKLQQWLIDKNITNDNSLKLGATGDQVKKLQTWLKENQFYTGDIDGNFGVDTENAVKDFQKVVGLREDGQVGEYTLLAMEQWDEYKAALTNSASATSSDDQVYSSVSSKDPNTSYKKTYSNYYTKSYNSKYGYTNGMDCWAMSAYISGQLKGQGYTVRTIQYATSMAANHRTVQYYSNGNWVNYDYAGNGYSQIYETTSNYVNGVVVG